MDSVGPKGDLNRCDGKGKRWMGFLVPRRSAAVEAGRAATMILRELEDGTGYGRGLKEVSSLSIRSRPSVSAPAVSQPIQLLHRIRLVSIPISHTPRTISLHPPNHALTPPPPPRLRPRNRPLHRHSVRAQALHAPRSLRAQCRAPRTRTEADHRCGEGSRAGG